MMKYIIFSIFLISNSLYAGDGILLGEKLKFNITAVSSSLKTIRIDRGLEDGITEKTFYKIIDKRQVIALALSRKSLLTSTVLSIIKCKSPELLFPGFKYFISPTAKEYKITGDVSKSERFKDVVSDKEILKIDLNLL